MLKTKLKWVAKIINTQKFSNSIIYQFFSNLFNIWLIVIAVEIKSPFYVQFSGLMEIYPQKKRYYRCQKDEMKFNP